MLAPSCGSDSDRSRGQYVRVGLVGRLLARRGLRVGDVSQTAVDHLWKHTVPIAFAERPDRLSPAGSGLIPFFRTVISWLLRGIGLILLPSGGDFGGRLVVEPGV